MNINQSSQSVAVGLCSLYSDWVKHKENIIESLLNIQEGFEGDCRFILAIQDAGDERLDVPAGLNNVDVHYLSVSGISLARNKCISEARKHNSRWIIFYDATIFWPKKSASFIYQNRNLEYPPKVKLRFGNAKSDLSTTNSYYKKKLNPIYDTYVGAILFEMTFLSDLFFNENHGPGEESHYKSGEDVLFCFDYFSRKKSFFVYESTDLYVFHPPRPESFEKHRLYARGQGRIFRLLLSKYLSARLVMDCVLFFGNAVFRCLLLRKNSLTILRDRLAGFFDEV